jgi:hypothetical protein
VSLGKSLNELLGWGGPLTHRQYRAWRIFLADQYDRPTQESYYLMQIAQQVHAIPARVWGKADKTPLTSFRLRFGEPEERPKSKEEAAAWSRAIWAARLSAGEQGKT